MPSPALQKLETLPLTPLQSAPTSPANSSRPTSRRGSSNIASSSSSIQQFRKQSHGAHAAARPNVGALTAGAAAAPVGALNDRRSIVPLSVAAPLNAASSGLASLSSTKSISSPSSSSASAAPKTAADALPGTAFASNIQDQGQVSEAVDEEQMLGKSAIQASSNHVESALDDGESTDEEADVEGVLRTGNERFRRGSRHLSRLSSTLGEGITAHWKKSQSSESDQGVEAGSVPEPSKAISPSTINEAAPSASHGESLSASLPASAGLPDVHAESRRNEFAQIAESLPPIEQAKRLAAYRAVDVHVKPHHRVIGIGSGSTVPYVVDRLLEQGEEANKKRWFVPTGFQSKELIVNAGLKLGDVDQFPVIDVTIDGADDVDWALNAIKGGGACHLREKVLAEAAEEFIIVADYRKNNMLLGQSWKQGIPIETPPFAYSKVFDNLERIPGCMVAQLRMGKAKAGPVVTDNGNFVIDAPFDEAHMREPENLLVKIKMLTGVVEVGLFCGMARAAYFGNADGSVTVRWSDGQEETLKDGEQAKITADMIDENYRPTERLLTYQLPPSDQAAQSDGLEANKLKQRLEQLRMTST